MNRARYIALALVAIAMLVVPMMPLFVSQADARTDFTWDMFAVRRDCSTCVVEMQLGDGPRVRMSWGQRPPSPPPLPPSAADLDDPSELPEIEARYASALQAFEIELAAFDARGRGPIMLRPDLPQAQGPPLNFRSPAQIARMRTRGRLDRLGRDICTELEAVFGEALDGSDELPSWARIVAEVWDEEGRDLRIYADCQCQYNQGPVELVGDRERNLCEGGQ